MSFSYAYDNVGNITQEMRDGVTTTYVYDHLGQLTRVNDPNDTTSGSSGTTWVYNYDCGGNITSKKRYAYTTGNLGTLKQTIDKSKSAQLNAHRLLDEKYGVGNWKRGQEFSQIVKWINRHLGNK